MQKKYQSTGLTRHWDWNGRGCINVHYETLNITQNRKDTTHKPPRITKFILTHFKKGQARFIIDETGDTTQ